MSSRDKLCLLFLRACWSTSHWPSSPDLNLIKQVKQERMEKLDSCPLPFGSEPVRTPRTSRRTRGGTGSRHRRRCHDRARILWKSSAARGRDIKSPASARVTRILRILAPGLNRERASTNPGGPGPRAFAGATEGGSHLSNGSHLLARACG